MSTVDLIRRARELAKLAEKVGHVGSGGDQIPACKHLPSDYPLFGVSDTVRLTVSFLYRFPRKVRVLFSVLD